MHEECSRSTVRVVVVTSGRNRVDTFSRVDVLDDEREECLDLLEFSELRWNWSRTTRNVSAMIAGDTASTVSGSDLARAISQANREFLSILELAWTGCWVD